VADLLISLYNQEESPGMLIWMMMTDIRRERHGGKEVEGGKETEAGEGAGEDAKDQRARVQRLRNDRRGRGPVRVRLRADLLRLADGREEIEEGWD
jgi:hypothetical protein